MRSVQKLRTEPATAAMASEDDGGHGELLATTAEPAGGTARPGLAGAAQRQVVGDGLKVRGELGGCLIAIARQGLEAAPDHRFQSRVGSRDDDRVDAASGRVRSSIARIRASTTDEPRRGDENGRWPVTAS